MKKGITRLTVGLAVLIALAAPAHSQDLPELAGFAFRVTVAGDGVSLRCVSGCQWQDSGAAGCTTGEVCLTVNDFGDAQPSRTPTFVVVITRTTSGMAFRCERGCAWKNRSVRCEGESSCSAEVNEYGVRAVQPRVVGTPRRKEIPVDFSGHWRLVDTLAAGPLVPGAMDVSQSWQRDLPVVTVARQFSTGTESESYTVGGIEGGVSSSGAHSTSETKWDNKRLVIKADHYSGRTRDDGPYTERVEVWSLDGQDKLRVTVRQRESGVEAKPVTVTYRRR
jgi:hypothetical protein